MPFDIFARLIIKPLYHMWGAIASAAAGLTSGIVGAIQGNRAMKKERRRINNERAENENLFQKEYYQDLTQRSDMQYLLGNMRKQQQKAQDRVRGTEVVGGKTGDAVAVQKGINAEAMANATAQIGAKNEAHKQRAMSNYLTQKARLNAQEANMNNTQAQQAANTMANGAMTLVSAAGTLGDELGGASANGKSTPTQTTQTSDTPTQTTQTSDTPTQTTPVKVAKVGDGWSNTYNDIWTRGKEYLPQKNRQIIWKR